ncbi:hypothetical protein HS141_05760 [Cetobacterium somerae]|uniref:hypothetical protein n=1 Tax=Cetobacterium somerae TaxID=188913 RepID=UPI00211E53F8|nr:hypothetical protein [Cetobacterium somerae]MCQ9626476.1 hypothetical protein [Cetobacterium somerae]
MVKKILIGVLALSSFGFASEISTTAGESAVFAKKTAENNKPLLYLAENFHELAILPGFTMGAPSGLVSGYGVAFAGIAGRRDSDTTDGALAFGMGFGNPDVIGGSVSIGVGSIDPRDGGSFNRGNLNLNVGHHFKEYGLGWSVGMTGLDLWHAKNIDGDYQDPSFYTSLTKLWPNEFVPFSVTAGLGNNSFADINRSKDRKDKVDGFGAISFYLIPQLSLVIDYTSNILTTGISVVPFPDYPISVNLGATNLTEQGPNEKVAAIGSIAAAYIF